MADNARKRFTVQLDVEPKVSKSQVQAVLKNLGAIFSDFQKNSGKMTYFQELVDYLQQIDAELTRLKKIHGAKSVNKAFGGLGESIQKQLQEGLMINGQDFSQLDILRKKIDQVVQSGGKTKDLLPIAEEINKFFDLLGRPDDKMDLSKFGGDVKVQADFIHDTLDEVVRSFNLVKRNLTIGLGSGEYLEGAISTIDKLKLKLEEYKKLAAEADSPNINKERKKTLMSQIDNIQNEIIALGTLSDEMQDDFYDIMDGLNEGDISISDALNQLINILKIEVPNSVNTAEQSVENFSKTAVTSVKNAVRAIKESIDEMNKLDLNGDREYKERSIQMTSDGKFLAIDDVDGGVSTEKIIAMMLSNLSDDFAVALHSHPIMKAANGENFIEDFFSGSKGDMASVLNNMKMGYQATGLIAGDMVHILDTSKLTVEQMKQVMDNLQNAERQLAKELPEMFHLNENGDIVGYKQPETAEDSQKLSQILYSVLGAAFKNAGLNLNDAYSKYNIADENQAETLAKKLLTLSDSANQAVEPVDRLQAIIEKFNHDDVKMQQALSEFKQGLISAVEVFNRSVTSNIKISEADMNAVKNLKPSFGDGNGFGTGTGGNAKGNGSGTGFGNGSGSNVDISALQQTISTEADKINSTLDSLSNKLDGTLKVALENDKSQDIIQAINTVKDVVDTIHTDVNSLVSNLNANKAADANAAKQAEIDEMKQNLTQLLNRVQELNDKKVDGEYQGQEMTAQFMSNGTISTNYGEKGKVPWNRVIAALVSQLDSKQIMNVHSHPWEYSTYFNGKYANDHYSGSHGDLSAFKTDRNLGASLSAMITGNILKVFDISKLSAAQHDLFVKNLSNLEKEWAKSPYYNGNIKYLDNESKYVYPKDLSHRHMTTKIYQDMMYEALRKTGFDTDYINREIFHAYNLEDDEQLTQLATRLVELNTAADASISPVQRLSDILSGLGVNTSSSETTTALLGFEKGELSAVDVINRLASQQFHISDDLVNATQNIDSRNEPAQAESILTNILNVLNSINTAVENIQTVIKPTISTEMSTGMDNLLRASYGASYQDIIKGVPSIYDPNNVSEYKALETVKIAAETISSLEAKIRNMSQVDLDSSDIGDVLGLIEHFKIALSNAVDSYRQITQYNNSNNTKIVEDFTGIGLDAADYIDGLRHTLLSYDDFIKPLLDILNKARNIVQNAENQFDIGTVRTNQVSNTSSSVKYTANTLDIQEEQREIEELIRFIDQVKVAVDAKTLSFEKEGRVVQSVVQSEENQLDILESRLDKVTIAIDNNTNAFVSGKNTIDSIVDAEIDKLNELCKKLIEVKLSINEISQLYGKQTTGTIASEAKPTVNNEVNDIQKKADAYNKLIERIKDLINLSKEMRNEDIRLLPSYDEYGKLGTNTGYIGSRNIVNNRASKSSIRRALDEYNFQKSNGSDSLAESAMRDLISCVATYRKLDDARDIFKKNELDIWEKVINRINAAKEAKEAFEKYNARNDRVLLDAAKLGEIEDKSVMLGDVWKFDKFIKTGDLDKILAYLGKRFQLKAPEITANVDTNTDIKTNNDVQPVNQENLTQLDTLKQKALEVKNAINEQTEAFEREKSMVNTTVDTEVTNLETLRQKLVEVTNAVDAKTRAFEEEYVTVDAAVESEMVQLNALLDLLKQIITQVGILNDGFSNTGKNTITSGGTITVNHEMTKEYALDTTLMQTNTILNNILTAINNDESIRTMTGALSVAIQSLKDVSSGIVQHQKTQKSDTKVAMARIQDPKKLAYMSGLAKDSIGDLGTDAEIESYQALTNGLVKFEGVFKNAQGQWEGFTVKINEHNEAVDLAIKKHSALANKLNNTGSLDDNPIIYTKKEDVEARAQRHLDEYSAQGKNATVQFKDSGRYTITILEEIDGLTKKIFQTFDENDKMIERTTVTMSNAQKTKLENLQKKLIDDGIDNGLIGDEDEAYNKYQEAAEALMLLTEQYSKQDELSDKDIANWKQQIALVQQLGDETVNLIQQRKEAQKADDAVFSKMKEKKKNIGKYQTNLAGLDEKSEADIPVINEIKETLVVLNNEYDALEKQLKKPLSTEQLKELSEIAEKTADDIRLARAKMDGSIAAKNKKDIKKATDDAAKEAQKEVDNAFAEMKNKKKTIGALEVELAKLDNNSEKDAPIIEGIASILNRLKNEYTELESGFGEFLSTEQVKELGDVAQKTADNIRIVKAELEGVAAAKNKKDAIKHGDDLAKESQKEIDAAFNQMVSKKKSIGSFEATLAQLDAKSIKDAPIVKVVQNIIDRLNDEYNKLNEEFGGFLSKEQADQLTAIVQKNTDEANIAKAKKEGADAKKKEEQKKADQKKIKTSYDKEIDSFDKYTKSIQNADYLTTELRTKIEGLTEQLLDVKTSADLSAWQEEFKKLSHEIDVAKAQFTGKHNNIAKGYRGQIDDAMNGLGIDTNSDDLNDKQKEIVDLYDKASAAVTAYKENAQQGNEVEASGIRETIKLLKEKADQYRKENDISSVNPKNFGATATRRETTRYGRLSEVSKSEGYSDSEEFKTKFSEYEKKYKELKELQEKFANSDILTNEEVKQWDELKDIVANMGKELEKSVRASEKLKGNNDWETLGSDFMDNKEGREKALTDYVKAISDADVQSIEFKDNYKKCVALIKDSDGSFKKVTATIDTFGNRIVSNMNDAGESISNVQKFLNLAEVKFKQIFAYMAASFGIQEVIQEVRRGITYIKEIDDALTELKKVTNETDAEYQHFLQNMSKTASVVGSTVTDLTRSAADWARLGYSMNEAGKLAATTAKLLNVSEFESVDDATSALVSSLQAFNKDGYDVAQRAEEIVDILNNIGNKYPVATNELASGLASSGAALVAANNSIEEQVAMLAAGNATMQDISSVASGLKIVAARLRGTTSEADDDAESAVTNVSKLQEKIKTLTAEANGGEGIDIINEDGSYKSTWEILTAISEIFDKMDDMSQASLLELIAGKNRSSVVAAILQNGDILKEAYSDAFDSKGSAQKELDTYLDSIQGKVDKFTTSLQTMWMNLISSDFIKWVVDLGTALITVLDKIGLFPTALIGIVGYFSLIKKISPVGIFKELGGAISGYTSAIEQLNSLSQSGFNAQTITAYARAVSGLSAKKQALALAGAGLNRQQIQEVLTRNQVNDATIEQIMSEGELAAAKNLTTTATVAETIATEASTNAALSDNAQKWLLDNSSKQLTLDLLHEAVAHEVITKEVAEEIAAKSGLIATNQQAASTSSSLWKTFTAMPLLGKISLIVTAVSAIFTIGKKIYDYFNPSTEELVQKWDDLKNEIDNINSELETTQSRIDELNSKGVLSITDKQELQQLKQTNDELERRLRLTEQNAEDAGNKAKKAVKKDYEKEFVFAPVVTNKAKKEYNEAHNAQLVLDSMKTMPDFSAWDTMEQYQKNALANLAPDLYKKVVDKAFYDLDEATQEEFFAFETKLAKQMSNLEASALGAGAVSGEEYIDQSIQRIKELKDELYNTSGQIRPNIDDEYAKEVYDQIEELENDLISASGDLYNYMDQYGGDAGDAFVRNLQAQIDKIDMTVNPVEFYGKKFDEILGKYSDKKVELYKLAEAGELSADVLNGLSYKPLMSELTRLGITAQDVVNHIRSLSETDITKVTNPEFNIADYANDIDSIQENISTLQSALESLESGTFTYSDFIDLTQQFPELAKGVDTSSKSFNGLARNLKRAIKASPDELVDELKDLKKQLQANGKSTVAIDQLINSIENLPVESVTNLSDEYVTLTDKINAAKQAQNELQEAMSENPNEGYETRGEAMEYMKDKMKRGEIGSESELWDVAEQYGFTYDSAKSINENADALAEFIAIREQWFAKNDDGDYTFTGTEDFIQSVENAISSEDFKTAMAEAGLALEDFIWSYDDSTGAFNFDFDNANWDTIVNALSKTKELAGLTSEEFHDMLVQIGQYFGFNWEDYNDIETHLKTIADGASDAKTKVKEYGEVMQAGFGKDTKIDLTNRPRIDIGDGQYETVDSRAYSNEEGTVAITVTPILPDGTKLTDEDLEKYANDIINGADPATYEFEVNGKSYTGDDIVLGKHFGADSIEQANEFGQALHNAQEEYYALVDEAKNNPLSIKTDGDVEKDIINPLREVGLKVEEIFDEAGNKQFKLDVVDLETLLRDEGYTTENIMAIVNRIFGEGSENSKLVQLREDILNIDKVSGEVLNTLDKLGATYGVSGTSQGAHIYIDSNINTLLSNLHFTDAEIATLKEKWEQNGIIVRTESDISGVEDSQEALDKQPENVTTTVDLDTAPFHEKIKPVFNDLDKLTRPRTATVTINTVTKETTTSSKSSTKFTPYRQNAMYADGTAHAQGSWGAKESGTSLVGELGPEILVRNGRWTTVGDNGAEFTQVKKGDIIFNHKQTEDLLSKGYITGRGKMHGGNSAFANGTAFVDGGSTFASYDFDGKGGYTKYDANDNAADKISDAADKISDAADKTSDAADEFHEVFDWVEVRLEEIDENLGLLSAQLENASNYSAKNNIVDSMIGANKNKIENLAAGIAEYTEYASKLLNEVPSQFRDAAQNGAIAIKDFAGDANEKTVEAINNYREWAQKVADLKQQLEEVKTEIRDLARQKFDNIYEAGNVRATVEDSQTEKLQNAVDLIEESGKIATEEYYKAMMENSNKTIEYLTKTRDEMQKVFNEAVEAGIIVRGSNEWYEMVDELYQIDAEIDGATKELEEFQNAINDIYWSNFDQLINRLDYLKDETQNLIDLMDDVDIVDDNGDWTNEGLASLGLYAQQMEIAEYKSKQYAEAIDDLTADFEAGLYSEDEYIEKLAELKDAQYDSIEAYDEAKKAIVDLNETRVDAIKKGIEKEIDAYEELIEKKKEALDSEKDLYDFQRSTMEQQKTISEIERQLAALSNDTSLSAVARRKQLEAELAEAQYELQDTYYNRSVEDKQSALDKELESFRAEKEAEIEAWDEYLTNIETVVAESLGIVQENATSIYDTLMAKAEEYDLTISDAIMTPWQDGSFAVSDYQEQFNTAMSSTMNQLEALKNKWQEVIDKMLEASKAEVSGIHNENNNYVSAEKEQEQTQNPSGSSASNNKPTETKTIKVGGKINASGAKIYSSIGSKGQNQYYSKDPVYVVLEEKSGYLKVRHHSLKSGVTGWFKKSDIKAYAKGSLGVDKDQLALIDELGEELQLVPGKNGRLEYIKKGTAIVPADLTNRLIDLAMDPQEMLDRNRPTIGASPSIVTNTIEVNMNIAEVVHIDKVDNDTIQDLTKAVRKEMDSYMGKLNNAIKSKVR